MVFILFVVIGGFFIQEMRWIRVVHLGSLVWAVYAELSPGVICPLTTLENYFGYHAGLSTYKEDFIIRISFQSSIRRALLLTFNTF